MAQFDLKLAEVIRRLNEKSPIKYRYEGGYNKVAIIGHYFKADFSVAYSVTDVMDTKIDKIVSEVSANVMQQCKTKYPNFGMPKSKKRKTNFCPVNDNKQEIKVHISEELANKLSAVASQVGCDVSSVAAQAIEFALENM